jgi:hypothetical protein
LKNHVGDKEQETTDLVDDGPARQKRGNYHGKKKLFNFQQIVNLKEAELAGGSWASTWSHKICHASRGNPEGVPFENFKPKRNGGAGEG